MLHNACAARGIILEPVLGGIRSSMDVNGRDLPTEGQAPLLLRVDTAAEMLSVSRSFLYGLIARGELPSVRIGGCRRIDAAVLRRWIDERSR
jgi:excisionase family DNA binding protein